ncbi:hypothetical protein N7532_008909 [Penicillium argentinense]|uniref:Multicopper oxidase n=1 Tax=Penicillium argentinense TaxID=1131581 RepID=A0A9W9K2C2_9EURO|nr:uncharacterized protein N7532_008909 [Penicillium argentinense]KAJ5090225.1 hypothetical protein N7532_008909 [Penicillium argentinense]
MKSIHFFLTPIGATSAISLGHKQNNHRHKPSLHPQKRDVCSGNSASDRQTWCNYSLSTNYYDVVPDTGVTKEYYFDIQEVTVAPDGYSRTAMAVNGSIPGPTIQADWGDNVVVHVTNSLASAKNGSSVHFHGIRQNYTNPNDGVMSITQCPTAPGKSTTYKWRATQYGSTWYHSHIGLQAWEGVFGCIVINGPASENYDEGMGQRYDIVVNADQSTTNESFWLRAIPQSACSDNDSTDNIKGIIYYGSTPTTPTTTGYTYTDSCDDMDTSDLVPYLSQSASVPYYNSSEPITLGSNFESLFRWKMNGTSMQVYWDNPSLLQIWKNDTAFTNTSGVVELTRANEWSYVVIETSLTVPHPIHLHGHDFFVLAQGMGSYSSSDISTLTNLPCRDTAMLPSSGYLVVAFKTDNPGAWLMHCHIGWHTEEGFAIQFLERWKEARELIDYETLHSTCQEWDAYTESSVEQEDDGI